MTGRGEPPGAAQGSPPQGISPPVTGAAPPAGELGRPPQTILPPATGDAPPTTDEIALPPPVIEAPADAGEVDAASAP